MGKLRRIARIAELWLGRISLAQWLSSAVGGLVMGAWTWAGNKPLWLVAFVALGSFAIIVIIWTRISASNEAKVPVERIEPVISPSRASAGLQAEAKAIARELEGRIRYARRVLENNDPAELRTWRGKVELQRVPFDDLCSADASELSAVQHEHYRSVLRALAELDNAIDLMVAHPRRFKLAHSVGIFRQRATKARVLLQEFFKASPDYDDGNRIVARDVELSEALAYAITGEWGARFIDVLTEDIDDGGVWQQSRQLAHDGKLTIWGKRTPHSVFEKIGPDFWVDHQPEWFSLMRGDAHTEPTTGASGGRFIELMASRAEFEREWPHR